MTPCQKLSSRIIITMWHEIFMDKQLSSYVGKNDHATPLLKDLHWLTIAERIKFNIRLLTFKGLHEL